MAESAAICCPRYRPVHRQPKPAVFFQTQRLATTRLPLVLGLIGCV